MRLTITPEKPTRRKPITPSAIARPKKLVGYGAFEGMFGGSEAVISEKQAEIALEERNC